MGRSFFRSIKGKLVGGFLGLSVLLLVLIFFAGQRLITTLAKENQASFNKTLPLVKASLLGLAAGEKSINTLEDTLGLTGANALDRFMTIEGEFQATQIQFNMFMNAILLGSTSPEFAKAEGGLTKQTWEKQGWDKQMVVERGSPDVRKAAQNALDLFNQFTAFAAEIAPKKKRALRLMFLGKAKEAAPFEEEVTLSAGKVNEFRERLTEAIKGMVDAADREAEQAQRQIAVKGRQGLSGLVAFTLVILGVAVLASVWFAGRITRPINDMVRHLNDLAERGGDLTRTVAFSTGDELEDLGEAVNRMRGGIREIIVQMREIAEKLQHSAVALAAYSEESTSALESISSAVGEIAGGAEKGAYSTNVVVGIVKEISAIAVLAGQSAETNRQVAQEAVDSAREGGSAITSALENLEVVKNAVGEVADLLAGLSQHSERITAVIDIIKEVANDTRLFALNTRVQASQLPDEINAKPFVVLAGEIRNLSVTAKENAKTIAKLIQEVTEQMERCRDSIDRVRGLAASGASRGDLAKEALETLRGRVARSAEEIALISKVTGELVKGNETINARMVDLAQIASNNASAISEVSATTQEQAAAVQHLSAEAASLKQQGEELLKVIRRFTV